MNCLHGKIRETSDTRRADKGECELARLDAAVVAAAIRFSAELGLPARPSKAPRRKQNNAEQHALAAAFKNWKTQTERAKGHLLGTALGVAGAATPKAYTKDPQWLLSLQTVRDFYEINESSPPEDPDSEPPPHSIPLPPLRRIHKRLGKWWIWVTRPPHAEGLPYRHQWIKLDDEVQETLHEASAEVRARLATACAVGECSPEKPGGTVHHPILPNYGKDGPIVYASDLRLALPTSERNSLAKKFCRSWPQIYSPARVADSLGLALGLA